MSHDVARCTPVVWLCCDVPCVCVCGCANVCGCVHTCVWKTVYNCLPSQGSGLCSAGFRGAGRYPGSETAVASQSSLPPLCPSFDSPSPLCGGPHRGPRPVCLFRAPEAGLLMHSSQRLVASAGAPNARGSAGQPLCLSYLSKNCFNMYFWER